MSLALPRLGLTLLAVAIFTAQLHGCDEATPQEATAVSSAPTVPPSRAATLPPAFVPRAADPPQIFFSGDLPAAVDSVPPPGDSDADGELDDGSYSATVENTTQSHGPYDLEVEVSGSEVTVHFPNGGYIVTDIDHQEWDGSEWILETSHSETGDDWILHVIP